MTDCFRAAALTGWANFISWKFPSIWFFFFFGKSSQNAGVGVLYVKPFSLVGGMCQDIEVHLIVRTRQWLSEGEGRLRLGGPGCCSHQFLLVTRKWVSLQGALSVWTTGDFQASLLQAGKLKPSLLPIAHGLCRDQAGPSVLLQSTSAQAAPAAHGRSGTSAEEIRTQWQQKQKMIGSWWLAKVLDEGRECHVRSVMVCECFDALIEMCLLLDKSWWCLKRFCVAK